MGLNMVDMILVLLALTTFVAMILIVAGMVRPRWAFQESRGKVAKVYSSTVLGCMVVAVVIGAWQADVDLQSSPEERPQASAESPSQEPAPEAGPIERLPDLAHEELIAYLEQSEVKTMELTEELVNRYAYARKSGVLDVISAYNVWRGKEWMPKVDELRTEYDLIMQQRRRQILGTPLKGIFIAPAELSIASIQLTGRIDGPNQEEREQSFRSTLQRIADGFNQARDHLENTTLNR